MKVSYRCSNRFNLSFFTEPFRNPVDLLHSLRRYPTFLNLKFEKCQNQSRTTSNSRLFM